MNYWNESEGIRLCEFGLSGGRGGVEGVHEVRDDFGGGGEDVVHCEERHAQRLRRRIVWQQLIQQRFPRTWISTIVSNLCDIELQKLILRRG